MKKLSAESVYYILTAAGALFFSTIFTLNMVYQVEMVKLNPLQLVLVGTMLEGSIFLFEIPTGLVADVYSRRLSIVIGYFLIGAGFILEGALPLFGTVLAAQVLWGIGYTFTSGATQAWIADEVGEARAGTLFLRGTQAAQIGGLAGILVSVALGSIRVNVPILAGGALFAVLAVFLILAMPETGFAPTPREARSSWQQMGHTFRSGLGLVRRRPGLMSLLGVGLFFGLYSEGFDRLWTAHLLENFTFPALGDLKPVVWFGIIGAVARLITLAGTELVQRRWSPDKPLQAVWTLFASTLALVAALLTFAQSRSFALALAAYWTITFTRNLNDPYLTAWINRHLESEVRATVISMSSQIDALGQIIAGPILGAIGTVFSVRTAIFTSGLVLAPVLILLLRLIPRETTTVTIPRGEPPDA